MPFGHTVRGFPCPWSAGRPRRSRLPLSADSMRSEFPPPAFALALTAFGPRLHGTFSGRSSLAVPFQSYPGPLHFLSHALLRFSSGPLLTTRCPVFCCPSLLSRPSCRPAGLVHFVYSSISPAPTAVPGMRLPAGGVWASGGGGRGLGLSIPCSS